MKHRYLIFATLCCSIICFSEAFGQFKLTAEIRPRAEFRNGFKSPIENGVDPAFFVEQRTRLYADYASEKFDVSISLQDVRIWGAVSQVYKSDPSLFNVYEAYATYHISSKHHIGAGRMALDYDNARFLGNLDWAQQGRSHDLLKYTYVAPEFQLDIGAAFNQDASTPEYQKLNSTYYSGVSNYKTMQYAWINKAFDKVKASVLILNNGTQYAPDTVYFSQTMGTYIVSAIGNTSLELELYYQAGKNPAGNSLGAYLASASWNFIKNKPLNLSAGVDVLSGDNPDTDQDEAFNPLYGTNHKFYGFMDYFYVGNGHGNKGLFDFNLKAKVKTGEKTSLLIQAHQFMANAKIPGKELQSDDLSSNLGTEIDLVFNADLGKNVKLSGGYSQMFQTDSMNAIKGKSDTKPVQNWAWAMLVFKPVLFDNTSK